MATTGAAGFNKTELSKFIMDVDGQLVKIKKSLEEVEEKIKKIEKGENGVPYWSGNRARFHLTRLRRCVLNDIKVYNAFVEFLQNLETQSQNQKDQ